MRVPPNILLLCNLIILFCDGTIYTAASSEVSTQPPAHPRLAQFSPSPSSDWPGTDTSGKRTKPPSPPAKSASTQAKVPLPTRRPVIDAGKKDEVASPESLAENRQLSAPDREQRPDAAVTGRAVKTAKVAAQDDPVWLRCSENTGSAEGAGLTRIQACTEILARSPADPAERRQEALKMRAVTYDSLNSDQAFGDYAASLTLDPNDMQILFLRSAYHARRQKYDMALADLDRIVAAQPGNARAFAERGRVYEQKKDLISAEKDYRRAVELDSNSPEHTSSLRNIEKIKLAEANKNRNRKSAVFGVEDELFKSCANFSDSPDKRIEACSAVIARLPTLESETAFFSAEKVEDLSKSIDRILTAGGFDTTWMNIAAAIGLRGVAYAEKHDLKSALVDINNAIDKAGRMIYRNGTASTLDRMMLKRGDIFMEMGEYQRAEDDFRTVARVNLVAEAHTRLAALHFTRGRHDQAQEEIRIALKRDPKDGLAYSLRGRIGLAQGDYRKALEDCQQAVDIQPKSSPNARACVETARKALQANEPSSSAGDNPAKAE